MINLQSAFSPSYARARVQFLEGAATAGMAIRSHNHPLPGIDGETLAMDVALDGAADAQQLLIVSSAGRGVEGFCGSGVQVFATHDAEWRQRTRAAGVAVLYIHALNPHGFSFQRCVTHENVDLLHNAPAFGQPQPDDPAYAELHPLLLPTQWPPSAENEADLQAWINTHGLAALQSAVLQGQYPWADGLGHGGTSPCWSHRTLREVLRTHGSAARRIAWIDLHTGHGPSGACTRFLACRDDDAAQQRVRRWWDRAETPVVSMEPASFVSVDRPGLMCNVLFEACPQAETTGLALAFGTVPFMDVLQALRAEQWLVRHPEAGADVRRCIRQLVKDAFYIDTDAWRAQVVVQARQALFQALDGLTQKAQVEGW